MKSRVSPQAPLDRRVGLVDSVLGALGGFIIATTLLGVRAWAWMSRTPYYKD